MERHSSTAEENTAKGVVTPPSSDSYIIEETIIRPSSEDTDNEVPAFADSIEDGGARETKSPLLNKDNLRFKEKYDFPDSGAEATVFAGFRSSGIKPYFQASSGLQRGDFSAEAELRCRVTEECRLQIETGEVLSRDMQGYLVNSISLRLQTSPGDSGQDIMDKSRLSFTNHQMFGDRGTHGSVFLNGGDSFGVKLEHDRTLYEFEGNDTIKFSGGVGVSDIGSSNQFNASAGVFYHTTMTTSWKHLDKIDLKVGYGAYTGENYGEKIGIDLEDSDFTHGFILKARI